MNYIIIRLVFTLRKQFMREVLKGKVVIGKKVSVRDDENREGRTV